MLIIRQDCEQIVVTPRGFLDNSLASLGVSIGTEPTDLYKYFPREASYGTTDQPLFPRMPGFARPAEDENLTEEIQTRPAIQEPLIPGRDAMIVRNLMRASMPEAEPVVQTPLPTTQAMGSTVPAAINQPAETATPEVGATRLIADPRGTGYLLQTWTGNKDLGWQSKEALQNYLRNAASTMGTVAAEPQIRTVAEQPRQVQAPKETPAPTPKPKQRKFGERIGSKFYAGADYAPQSAAGLAKVREIREAKALREGARRFPGQVASLLRDALLGLKGLD